MEWKAGIAKAVITPEKPVWLAGYGGKRVPDGVLHDLWVKVLALEDAEGRRAALITSDLMGLSKVMYESISDDLKKKLSLDRSQVMVTFTHNHCGPVVREDLVDYYPLDDAQNALVAEYSDLVEKKIVDLVGEAFSKAGPATLAFSAGATDFAVNRRDNVEADVEATRAAGKPLKGVVDHRVPVLTVRTPAGELSAVLFGYACHPTTLSFTKWCGDYPGFAQIELEKKHPETMAMFFTGCGADQNPLPRRTPELCEKYGRALAAAVEDALDGPFQPLPSGLRTAFAYVDLDYEKVPTRETLTAAAEGDNVIRARWARRKLAKIDTGQPLDKAYPYPVQAWRLGGELLWISLGAEAVVDFSHRFQKDYGPNTWVFGYAHVLVAYIPSRRVWEEGGYEGGARLYEYGIDGERWAGDVEQRVAKTVAALVRDVTK